MHQCLNCSKSCIETTIFCDECRTSLLKRQLASDPEQAKRIIRPAKVRKGLPVFMILGAISLITGGVLLAVNILQQHPSSLTNMAATTGTSSVLSPQVGSTIWPGETQTPTISPVASTPISTSTGGTPGMNTETGTATGITSTTTPGTVTPAPGTATPVPTSIPATTPTIPPNTCILQVAPTHLSFTATLLQPDPPGQKIMLKTTGTCGEPVTWAASADASWIQLSRSNGSDNGSSSAVTVSVHSNQIIGIYNAHITFTAVDSNGITIPSNPQTISVTLTVLG